MTYEEFMAHIPQKCMYETIYEDSEGVPILVIRLLDAYVMVNRLVKAEREACAKVCEDSVEYAGDTLAAAIRARG